MQCCKYFFPELVSGTTVLAPYIYAHIVFHASLLDLADYFVSIFTQANAAILFSDPSPNGILQIIYLIHFLSCFLSKTEGCSNRDDFYHGHDRKNDPIVSVKFMQIFFVSQKDRDKDIDKHQNDTGTNVNNVLFSGRLQLIYFSDQDCWLFSFFKRHRRSLPYTKSALPQAPLSGGDVEGTRCYILRVYPLIPPLATPRTICLRANRNRMSMGSTTIVAAAMISSS